MKQANKLFAIVLAFVLSISMIPVTNVSAAKVKLNKKKVAIYVGQSVTLKLKNNKKKVKWSSSNKRVASVSKKGNVVGIKAGKATITAKVGKKKYKCKVTVKKYDYYPSGIYKVGTDIPPGEYVAYANDGSGYVAVCMDPMLNEIIANDNFNYNVIFKCQEGDYVELSSCYAYPIEKAELDITRSGSMYKVGMHIKAGTYMLNGRNAYYEINNDAIGGYEDIIANDIFNGNAYVTVYDGQYITLSGCTGNFVAP